MTAVVLAASLAAVGCSSPSEAVDSRKQRPPARLDITDDCVGIVPDTIGDSFSFDVPPPPYGQAPRCDNATSDESGNLAASSNNNFSWELFSPSGDYLAHVPAQTLFPQPQGYEGIYMQQTSIGPSFPSLAYWLPDGTQQANTPVGSDESGALAFRAWPSGALTVRPYCRLGPPGGMDVTLFDAQGQMSSPARISGGGCSLLIGAVGDANGNSLVLVQGESSLGFSHRDVVGIWLDSTGAVLTPFFLVASGVDLTPLSAATRDRFLLHALIGGGAALALDGSWRWTIASGATDVGPAPDFLASHPQTDFTLVRGAQAYAVVARGAGDPTTVMELFSAQGNRCGALSFTTGNLTTGADGSVIGSSGAAGCTKTVWPALLQ